MRTLPLLVLWAACAAPAEEPPVASAPDGPPTTDIYLFRLSDDGASLEARVTDRDGYDNQPHFTPDGVALLFTSDRSGSMDTYAYSLADGSTTRVTFTPEGEYSPTVLPHRTDWFSVIRMDTTGTQELWQYPLSGQDADPELVAAVDRVGYHTWIGTDRVLFFRLGQPATLQLVSVGAADTTIVARRVGRSLHRIPGEQASSYSITLEDGSREIRRYDWESGASSGIAVPLDGSQDYAWTPGGSLMTAIDGELYRFSPGQSLDWELVANLGVAETSRLAISPDGSLVAVVALREQ